MCLLTLCGTVVINSQQSPHVNKEPDSIIFRFKIVSADVANKEADTRHLAKQLLYVNPFLKRIFESLQKVSYEILSEVKEMPYNFEQSVKLDSIEEVFGHALKKFLVSCKEAFILSLQLRMKCRMEPAASLRKAEQLEFLQFSPFCKYFLPADAVQKEISCIYQKDSFFN